VRHYFLRADDPAKASEAQALVRRLQRMDVKVYRLTAPLAVPDFKPYVCGCSPDRRLDHACGRRAGGQRRGRERGCPRVAAAAERGSATRTVLARYRASYTLRTTGSKAEFLIANPAGLSGDDHPYAGSLPNDLTAAGVRVIAFRAP
jgi:hypothetical protein